MSEDLAQTVSALEARLKRLEATDDSWSQLFTPDGVFDVGELGFCRGTEELRAYMRSLPNEIHWAHHYMSNEIIDVADDGESGTANWLIWEVATMASDERSSESWKRRRRRSTRRSARSAQIFIPLQRLRRG